MPKCSDRKNSEILPKAVQNAAERELTNDKKLQGQNIFRTISHIKQTFFIYIYKKYLLTHT